MAGHTLDDAKAAQCAATRKIPHSDSCYPATTTPDSPFMACVACPQCAHIKELSSESKASITSSMASFCSYLTLSGSVKAFIDWNKEACFIYLTEVVAAPILTRQSCVFAARVSECPFTLDSRAMHHISPEQSNFHSLPPITPHLIQGLYIYIYTYQCAWYWWHWLVHWLRTYTFAERHPLCPFMQHSPCVYKMLVLKWLWSHWFHTWWLLCFFQKEDHHLRFYLW